MLFKMNNQQETNANMEIIGQKSSLNDNETEYEIPKDKKWAKKLKIAGGRKLNLSIHDFQPTWSPEDVSKIE